MTSRNKSLTTFPRRLAKARKAVGLTQFELGVAAGIDEYSASPRMNQYERGVHMPDLATVGRLAIALAVPVSYLLEPNEKLAEVIRLAGLLSQEDLEKLGIYLRDAIGED